MLKHLPEKIGIVCMAAVLGIITGCDSVDMRDNYTSGREISYCVVEDTPPSRLVCVNGILMKENPLFGSKQGEFPYTKASTKDWSYGCYCNPDLVTAKENMQQGTISKK